MTLTFQEPEYLGLYKIISGGQCGADRGGLEAAYALNVLTGGTAPRGFITARGRDLELQTKYNLIEDASAGYNNRTKLNVEEADGTLIIVSNIGSPGSHLTLEHAWKRQKPVKIIIVEPDLSATWLGERGLDITEWIIAERIYVLNVAGNRDKRGGSLHHEAAIHLLNEVLLNLQERELLVTKAV